MENNLSIPKLAENKANFLLHHYDFNSAREAFYFILKKLKKEKIRILLPAYIGVSEKEGSGIFDPVKKSGIDYSFYGMNDFLIVDLNNLKSLTNNKQKTVVLIVNYFGLNTPNKKEIISYLKSKNIQIIEDNSHAIFSFYNSLERDFDYTFFSIHKMLPFSRGGILVSKTKLDIYEKSNLEFLGYDFKKISDKRIKNYLFIHKELKNANYKCIQTCKIPLLNSVPQTYPFLLDSTSLRDNLYFKMNEKNFGAVSLYHKLIPEVDNSFKIEHMISSRILNLPVHQDISEAQLKNMIKCLFFLIDEFN